MNSFLYPGHALTVWQLRALKDNYVYILVDRSQKNVVAIDPSEAAPVLSFLREKNLSLTAIWNTHHHHDHVGGNLELKNEFSGLRIFCSSFDRPRVPGVTDSLHDDDTLHLGDIEFQVLNVPGHTLGAISFYSPSEKMVFTGDTLFTMGCGRLFEGSFEQMWHSLARLKTLPDDTAVYCGHEYTLQNTAFALTMAGENLKISRQLREKQEWVKTCLKAAKPTVPGRLGDEKNLNPFLNTENLANFTELRRLKDDFRLEP